MNMGLKWTGEEIDFGFDADPVESAALISLFTDARVAEEELPDGEADVRGFWGDGLAVGTKIGSRLWLLSREKATPEVLRLHEDYAREALSWLLDLGLAKSVTVRGAYDDRHALKLEVAIDGKSVTGGGQRHV